MVGAFVGDTGVEPPDVGPVVDPLVVGLVVVVVGTGFCTPVG